MTLIVTAMFCIRNTRWMPVTTSLIIFLSTADSTAGQTPGSTIVRVEEDWVALVAGPESLTSSPQILNFISPIQSTEGIFGLVQLNHRGAPDFRSGGLQVQGWLGESMTGYIEDYKDAVLSRSSDNLRYTVAMEKTATGIKFQVLNGRSRTWGRFAQTPLSVTISVNEPSLEDYTPEFSVANTNVNHGAHRVDLLYLTTSRVTYSDGQTVTDTTDRVIHRYQLTVQDVSLAAYESNPEDYNVEITE
jgi:hypothetical protein